MPLNTMNNPFVDASTLPLASSFTRFSSASSSSLLLVLALVNGNWRMTMYRHDIVMVYPLVIQPFAMENGPYISRQFMYSYSTS
jgi:hypothetical protein